MNIAVPKSARRLLTITVGMTAIFGMLTQSAVAGPTETTTNTTEIQACDYIPPNHDPGVNRIVYEVGLQHSVNDKVMLAGFEAGWVESHMNNLPCGDKDSLGVFQQRPSQGWGTPEQILNVHYAATQFFTRAIVCDRQNPGMTAGRVAQCVQRSGYPDRYDENEAKGRALLAEASRAGGSNVSGQAFHSGDSQHFVAVNTSGTLSNLSWSPSDGITAPDWGGAELVGKPMGYTLQGQQHVFARSSDNTLRHWYQSNNNPPGLDDWNTAGIVMSNPTGFAYGNQQHVFFRNADNHLEHRFYDVGNDQVNGGVWSDDVFVGNPYAFVHRDQQHIFARTESGALLHWYWWPGINPSVDNWNVTSGVASDITGFSYQGNQHHIFFRNTNGELEHRFFDDPSGNINGGVWLGGTFEGNPHAMVHGDQQHIFGRNADGDLMHWYWWPGINPAIDDWGAIGVVTGDPVGLSSQGQHHVFFRTSNGSLEHRYVNDADGQRGVDNWGGDLAET